MKKTFAGAVLTGCLLLAANALAGPFSDTGVKPDVVNAWATTVVDFQNQGTASNILGAVDGSWAIGSPGGGWISVGFDQSITNGTGADFAVWENGFGTSSGPAKGAATTTRPPTSATAASTSSMTAHLTAAARTGTQSAPSTRSLFLRPSGCWEVVWWG